MLLPAVEPRRVQVVQRPAVAGDRRPRPRRQLVRVRRPLHPRDSPLVGLTERVRTARVGYAFLVNKYYLDALYENGHRPRHRPPDRRSAAYWVNQNVIDGIVNGVGKGGRRAGGLVYHNIDQRVVDGAVNGSRAGRHRRRRRAAARAVGQGQPVRSAAVRSRSRRRPRARHRQRVGQGRHGHGTHLGPELAAERRHVPAARRRAGDAVHPRGRASCCTSRSPSSPRSGRSASASTR